MQIPDYVQTDNKCAIDLDIVLDTNWENLILFLPDFCHPTQFIGTSHPPDQKYTAQSLADGHKDGDDQYLINRAKKRKQKQQSRRAARRAKRMELYNVSTMEELKVIDDSQKAMRIDLHHKLKKWREECRLLTYPNDTLKIVIDCSHLIWHTDRTIKSLAKQINWIYLTLKFNLEKRVNITLTSFSPDSKLAFFADKHYGGNKWYGEKLKEPFWERYKDKLDRLIILSPDAEEELEFVSSNKIYIIGGIVDREVRKGETLFLSNSLNIAARKLPIRRYLPEVESCILNVNTVADILIDMFEGNLSSSEEGLSSSDKCHSSDKKDSLAITNKWITVLRQHIPTRMIKNS